MSCGVKNQDTLKREKPVWLLIPAALSLAVFAWLLSLHPTAAGGVYLACGGVYIGTAMLWLWTVHKINPSFGDYVGAAVCLLGMGIIMFGSRSN